MRQGGARLVKMHGSSGCVILAFLSMATACGGGGSSDGSVVNDQGGSTLTSRSPADGATGVALDANVTATFSENVTGVNGTTFSLSGPGGTVAAAAGYNAATFTAILDPNFDLAFDTSYVARLASGINDGAGNPMTPVSWTFRTRVLNGGFAPQEPNPGPDTTAMDLGSATGDLVTVRVEVTDTDGVYAAAFDVTYDPSMASYVAFTPGSLLEQAGHSPTYQVNASSPGRVVVGVSRNGNVPAVDAMGTNNHLISLTFRVRQAGSAPLTFGSPALYDGQAPPQPLSGIQWFGGSLTGD